jgi:hypothetical protein
MGLRRFRRWTLVGIDKEERLSVEPEDIFGNVEVYFTQLPEVTFPVVFPNVVYHPPFCFVAHLSIDDAQRGIERR